VAGRALFLVALRDPSHQGAIRDELRSLADSREPHIRIAANQTLEMLGVADLAHTAALDAEQRDEITNKLQRFTDINFFGEDFSWAAQEALDWLEQQGTEEH
jgi:ethanolamine ammonia-lyase large subunit